MPIPTVSTILPNYNYARFIGETIESVMKQTYTDHELIIVDDGSTDNSIEVISSYEARYPGRIRLVKKANGGLPSARNAALALCRGQFIAFLDSDDLWHEDYLRTMVSFFEQNPDAVAAYANAELFDSDSGRTLGHWFGPRSFRTAYSGRCADKLFTRGNFIPIVTAMIRREVLDKVGVFDEHYRVGEDWDFWLRVASRFDIHYIDRSLCRIRRHPKNLSFLPLNSYNKLRIYRKILRWNPELAGWIGKDGLDWAWYCAYYEVGRVLTLQGKGRRGRMFFRKALSVKSDFRRVRFWLFYPLTFLPRSMALHKVRQQVVRLRQALNPRAH